MRSLTLLKSVTDMKTILYLMLSVLGLFVTLVSGQFALAAEPAPITGEQPQQSGTIEVLNLEQGYIVIDDSKFRISDKVTVHGRNSGTKLSLRKGMKVRFASEHGNDRGRPVITEIWVSQ